MSSKKKFKGEVDESKLSGSALHVNDGVEQPPNINPGYKKPVSVSSLLSKQEYFDGIINGNRAILGKAITLVESRLPVHQQMAQELIAMCLPLSDKSVRIGITGVPGVGKSSFIESLGMQIIGEGRKLAVLAVDPSSERSKGSILGDKTRMEQLAAAEQAFIRPSPSAGSLGGVARKTRETIILCEAAGFDTIFIETVGVGQSETVVHSMVDFFLLLMLSGAGDELQGIKRGIMEMADAIAINKADGDNIKKAQMARQQYESALHLFPPTKSGWMPKVLTCSALNNSGIKEVWQTIEEYINKTINSGYFIENRNEQALFWMHQSIKEALQNKFYQNSEIESFLSDFENQIRLRKKSSFVAAQELLDKYFEIIKNQKQN
ncbi:MAG TPA: methylmalonyl Co-A mutase-associated GTPase MeaB [Bacteroidales bacterium]|nr:methylmalonyl Co-A mutase-associated GTPase MeaB [Bacteroidales bacterium]MDD4236324.1 methylmalonyl Co-A mutase-associated GTPase MeaB [Bacteroidales bacterium]HXK81017.1 methylmalonyl Co-A mutase-associated GTPase MeaB [Bacteroidales bacterium]